MKLEALLFTLIGAALVTSCVGKSYGEAPVEADIPQKLVFIHTTDTHAKYLPFWMEPNMFDRKMDLESNNQPCWDLDYNYNVEQKNDKNSYCNGAYKEDTGEYLVYENGEYVYKKEEDLDPDYFLPFEEKSDKNHVLEDLNKDGRCDVLDCQRCWDKNENDVCDKDEDVDEGVGCGVGDCWAQEDNKKVYMCWDTNGNGLCDKSEDLNKDRLCTFDDCALVFDKNFNRRCDYPYEPYYRTWIGPDGKLILRENYDSDKKYDLAVAEARRYSEDLNRDGVCDYSDYRPGLVYAGGVARAKTVIDDIRRKHEPNHVPVIYLDSGDPFQGAPQFNLYKGEVELISLQKLGLDAMVLGNHEFDNGTSGFVSAYRKVGGFPVLTSNYLFEESSNKGLMDIVSPYMIMMSGALRIGVVGVANDNSLNSAYQIGSGLGFNFLDPVESTQKYVNMVRPLVDIVVLLTHQGLDGDYRLAEKVSGVDLILGGHHHVVLDPPKIMKGPDGRDVIIVHSGVNMKIVGELEVAVQNKRIVWHKYTTHAVTDRIQEDGNIVNLLKPYMDGLDYSQYLQKIVGYAESTILRNDPSGGDSPLGNLVTDAMMNHDMARAQFCVTNSMGIRADIPTGDITLEKLYEVFPFENSITTMYLSGKELKSLFDYVARRSASRGCKTQIQAAGLGVELDCSPSAELQERHGSYALTKCLQIGDTYVIKDYELVQPHVLFKMATNDYMARGGSGFFMLEANTTRLDTSVSLRDALVEFLNSYGDINPVNFSVDQTGTEECGGGKRIRMLN